jgi:hypothetical protein
VCGVLALAGVAAFAYGKAHKQPRLRMADAAAPEDKALVDPVAGIAPIDAARDGDTPWTFTAPAGAWCFPACSDGLRPRDSTPPRPATATAIDPSDSAEAAGRDLHDAAKSGPEASKNRDVMATKTGDVHT